MTISSLLHSALLNDSGVAAIVGTRIYPLILPQPATYPAITFERVSNSGQNGTSNRKESRWQINCWCNKRDEANAYGVTQTLAAAVKAALEEYHDSPGIEYGRVVNEFDDYDDQAKVYRTIVDVMLTTTGD